MIIPKTLAHHPQNRPLQLIAETTPSFDNSCQHLTIFARKVSRYLMVQSVFHKESKLVKIDLTIPV